MFPAVESVERGDTPMTAMKVDGLSRNDHPHARTEVHHRPTDQKSTSSSRRSSGKKPSGGAGFSDMKRVKSS